jgi:hypothetical protein
MAHVTSLPCPCYFDIHLVPATQTTCGAPSTSPCPLGLTLDLSVFSMVNLVHGEPQDLAANHTLATQPWLPTSLDLLVLFTSLSPLQPHSDLSNCTRDLQPCLQGQESPNHGRGSFLLILTSLLSKPQLLRC